MDNDNADREILTFTKNNNMPVSFLGFHDWRYRSSCLYIAIQMLLSDMYNLCHYDLQRQCRQWYEE